MNVNPITYTAVYTAYDNDLFCVYASQVFKATPANIGSVGFGYPEDATGKPVELSPDECLELQSLMRFTLVKARKVLLERLAIVEANARDYIVNAVADLTREDEHVE